MTVLVYRNSGAWGTGKGSLLTSTEVDTNFYNLDQGKADRQNTTGGTYSMNGQNLIPNGSAEFGMNSWSAGSLTMTTANDANGAPYFTNTAAFTGTGGRLLMSNSVPVVAGTNVSVSGELSAATMTAGTLAIFLRFLDSTGAAIGTDGRSGTVGYGNDWGFVSYSAVAPANAVAMAIGTVSSAPTGAIGSAKFRRLKMEIGTAATTYSNESDWLCLGGNPPFNLSPIFAAVKSLAGVQGPTGQNLLYNTSGEFGVAGWTITSGQIGASFSVADGGYRFSNLVANTGTAFYAYSPYQPCVAGQSIACQGVIDTSAMTAGSASIGVEFRDGSGNLLLAGAATLVPFGTAAAWYGNASVAPASTTQVRYRFGIISSSAGPIGSAKWSQLKYERGTVCTAFSTEGNDAYLASLVTVLQGAPSLSGRPTFAGNTPWDSGNLPNPASSVGQTSGATIATGRIGELLTASQPSGALSAATITNVATITLTPGVWMTWFSAAITVTSGTASQFEIGTNITSATIPSVDAYSASYATAPGMTICSPQKYRNVSANTTLYAIARCGAAASINGVLNALRIV